MNTVCPVARPGRFFHYAVVSRYQSIISLGRLTKLYESDQSVYITVTVFVSLNIA